MEFLQDSIPMVSLAAATAALYARMSSSLLRPGLPRLVALLPLFPFLVVAPLAFSSSAIIRAIAAFFLAWLCAFKVALLAAGRGPLDPSLPVLTFLFTALLPVKLRRASGGSGAAVSTKASKPVLSLASCAVKVAVIAAILRVYQFSSRLHLYARLALYGIHIYCFLDLFFPCIAAAAGALGMETEPQFDRPYLASSLRDFWGRRWNLMVPVILRPSVYGPVRARFGDAAGVLASFLVSGLMHELIFYYLTWMPPSGDVTAFFVLHGVSAGAEAWWVRHAGWWRPPRAVAVPLTLAFVAGTGFWLFFPAMIRGGMDELVLQECQGMVVLMEQAGRWFAAGAGPVLSTR